MGAAAQCPVVYGAAYSVYVRIVRLALHEKGVSYDLEEVDIFADGGPPAAHLRRHPFGKIPAFAHQGFTLYETAAIARYIDEAFPGPPLLPEGPQLRARAAQIVGILDAYAYRTLVWDIYVERKDRAEDADPPDEAKIAAAVPRAAQCLDAIADLMDAPTYFLSDAPCLADLHAAPMIDYLRRAPEGAALLHARPRWMAWWDQMASRPSLKQAGLAV
jgi:glutathione S-transferase